MYVEGLKRIWKAFHYDLTTISLSKAIVAIFSAFAIFSFDLLYFLTKTEEVNIWKMLMANGMDSVRGLLIPPLVYGLLLLTPIFFWSTLSLLLLALGFILQFVVCLVYFFTSFGLPLYGLNLFPELFPFSLIPFFFSIFAILILSLRWLIPMIFFTSLPTILAGEVIERKIFGVSE